MPNTENPPKNAYQNQNQLFNMPDFYASVRSFSTPRDFSSLECASPVTRNISRSSAVAQSLQLAAWMKLPDPAQLPRWLSFISSPYTVIQALSPKIYRDLRSSTYLSCLVKCLSPSAFTLPKTMSVADASAILSNNDLQCGEQAVAQIVQSILSNRKHLTELEEQQLRACIRDGSPSSPFRTLGDAIQVQQHRLVELHGHLGPILSMLVLPGGRLVTLSLDHSVRIWTEQQNGSWDSVMLPRLMGVWQGHWVSSVEALPDGRLVTKYTGQFVGIWTEHEDRSWSFRQLNPSGIDNMILGPTIILPDGRIVTFTINSYVRISTEQQDGDWVHAVLGKLAGEPRWTKVLRDGRFVTQDCSGKLRIWGQKGGSLNLFSRDEFEKSIGRFEPAGSPTEQAVTGNFIELPGHRPQVLRSAELPNGRLVTASLDNNVRVFTEQQDGRWNVVELLKSSERPSGTGFTSGLAILPDGRLVTVSNCGTGRVWTELQDGGWKFVVLRGLFFGNSLLHLEVLPDGRFVTTSSSSIAQVWTEQQNGDWNFVVLRTPGNRRHDYLPSRLLLPDGRLVTSTEDGTAQVWSA